MQNLGISQMYNCAHTNIYNEQITVGRVRTLTEDRTEERSQKTRGPWGVLGGVTAWVEGVQVEPWNPFWKPTIKTRIVNPPWTVPSPCQLMLWSQGARLRSLLPLSILVLGDHSLAGTSQEGNRLGHSSSKWQTRRAMCHCPGGPGALPPLTLAPPDRPLTAGEPVKVYEI